MFLIDLSSINTPLYLFCIEYFSAGNICGDLLFQAWSQLYANSVMCTVPDFLLYAVTSLCVCLLDIFCIQLVSFLSWVCGMYEYKK